MQSKHLAAVAAVMSLAATACVIGTDGVDDSGEPEVETIASGASAGRQRVKANIDLGGGVLVANRPGGYYMGRLFPGMSFDRHGAWYLSSENGTNYAWSMVWGHTNACLWVGPSRGKKGFTAGTWATPVTAGEGVRCNDAQKAWLVANDAANLGSHFNCPPPSSSAHGTEKVLLVDAPLYWNLSWGGGPMGYDGGPARDLAATIPAGTHVWYRYTTRDGNHMVAFVPGVGWGFFRVGVLDRTRTGTWSAPETANVQHGC